MDPRTSVTRLIRRDGREVRVVSTYTIEALTADGAAAVLHVDRPLLRIGSHATNDLVLADPTVSKHHLEIAMTPDGYRISDLGSSNGTFAGGMRIDGITIVEPLTLRLGATTVRVTPRAQSVELPASPDTQFGSLLGRSALMRELFEQLAPIAASDGWLLIEGETGAGKEQLAESVHRQSPRARRPFVVVDCGALVPGLVEAELFGHVRGAFSGAESDRKGLLESAHGGTLFLDEVGDLPPTLQSSLLGALGRSKVTPVGSTKARPIDVRVIAATHRNLAREVNQGRFRSDLFYRLAVLRVRVPPLRERVDDIPLLVEHFLHELRARRGAAVPTELSAIVMTRLQSERWPGNVRELRNAVERAVLGIDRDAPPAASAESPDESFFTARARALEEFERRYFATLIEYPGMTLTRLARTTHLDTSHLQRTLRRLGLQPSARGRQRDDEP